MNTLLRQAQREVHRLKKNDSYYGMTEISIFLDFSRHPEEQERLTGYYEMLRAGEEENDNQSNLQSSYYQPDSEPQNEEPFLLCRVRVTKAQEKFLLNKMK